MFIAWFGHFIVVWIIYSTVFLSVFQSRSAAQVKFTLTPRKFSFLQLSAELIVHIAHISPFSISSKCTVVSSVPLLFMPIGFWLCVGTGIFFCVWLRGLRGNTTLSNLSSNCPLCLPTHSVSAFFYDWVHLNVCMLVEVSHRASSLCGFQ